MPEGLEAEIYARATRSIVGRRITSLEVDPSCGDPVALRGLIGTGVDGVRRHGKHVLIDTGAGCLGLHFGMTGRVIVDDAAPIEALEYGARREDARWHRLSIAFDTGSLVVSDPRRFSRYRLEPTLDLGVDLFAGPEALAEALRANGQRSATVKAVLLDQRVVAGLGNLCVDEVLFHAGIAPDRPMRDIDEPEALAEVIADLMPRMLRAGGSHTGDTGPGRREGDGLCALDGTLLERSTVAGRTTVACPLHQR